MTQLCVNRHKSIRAVEEYQRLINKHKFNDERVHFHKKLSLKMVATRRSYQRFLNCECLDNLFMLKTPGTDELRSLLHKIPQNINQRYAFNGTNG
ncbi:putative DNA-directed RNA polymerase specialized sigma subunit [Salmonella phage 41]|nr:putative DNA-directed RNA polymerase specialized sigma subunit [Salmonella phage 41]